MKTVAVRKPILHIALLAILLVLLPLLAWQQYELLDQLSTRERERLQAIAESGARQVSEEFDRAIAEISGVFRQDPAAEGEPLDRIATRYRTWRASDPRAGLIRDLYFVGAAAPDADPLLYRNSAEQFEAVPWPSSLEPIRAGITAQGIEFDTSRIADAVVLTTPVLSRNPVRAGAFELEPTGFVVVVLDRERLFSDLLQPILVKTFGGAEGLDFQAVVIEREAPGQKLFSTDPDLAADAFAYPDAAVDLHSGRTRDFIFVTTDRLDVVPEAETETKAQIVISRFWNEERHEQRFEMRTDEARWRLLLRHRAGSLEAAVGETRTRNLAISFAILLLLGATGAALFVSARRAGALARQQVEFVAGVSHELRTPLAVIGSAAENLTDAVVSDGAQVRRYGALISREGRRMSSLVENLLLFARVRGGADFLNPAPVDLPALLASLSGDLDCTTAEPLPPVWGDEQALRTIFGNLIDNARKYSDTPAQLAVECTATARNGTRLVRVHIHDRGWGMTPGERARIFQPFYRGATARERNVPGNGIGLSLVKRLVELHGGSIGVESEPGRGSVFSVELPAVPDQGNEA